MSRLALLVALLVFLLAPSCSAGAGANAASVHPMTTMTEVVVTCLSCGEQWFYVPASSFAAGFMSLLTRRRRIIDRCPKCHSRVVRFSQSN
jgi:hypothetical protein